MGTTTSRSVSNTEINFQLENCRSIRDSLKALQKSVTESSQTLSAVPRKILNVADGFTQVSTCASHGSPGTTTSQAGSPHSVMANGAPASAVPDSAIAVEMAADFTESMRQCDREHAPQYGLNIERDISAALRDLSALAARCVQDGKTASAAFSKYTSARSKVESIEASAKTKGKDVNGMSKYVQACTARTNAEANWNSYDQAFLGNYRKLLQEVTSKTPTLMQFYATHTVAYQRSISAGIANASASQPAPSPQQQQQQQQQQQPYGGGADGRQNLGTTQAAPALAGGVLVNEVPLGSTVAASPYPNASEPVTRSPSAPPAESMSTPQRRVKEDPPLPTPRSQQQSRGEDSAYPSEMHDPFSPATQANRSRTTHVA